MGVWREREESVALPERCNMGARCALPVVRAVERRLKHKREDWQCVCEETNSYLQTPWKEVVACCGEL